MGITVSGADEFRILLEQASKSAVRGVIAEMRKEGVKLRDLARDMAPVDVGSLEKAIKVRNSGSIRDIAGRFAKQTVEVYIDGTMSVPGRPGKTIGDYAWEIHTHLTPAGDWKLGKDSQRKQAGSTVVVGGGFMERASDKVSEGLIGRLAQVVQTFL